MWAGAIAVKPLSTGAGAAVAGEAVGAGSAGGAMRPGGGTAPAGGGTCAQRLAPVNKSMSRIFFHSVFLGGVEGFDAPGFGTAGFVSGLGAGLATGAAAGAAAGAADRTTGFF